MAIAPNSPNSNLYNSFDSPISSRIRSNHLPSSNFRVFKPLGSTISSQIRFDYFPNFNSRGFNTPNSRISSQISLNHSSSSNSKVFSHPSASISSQISLDYVRMSKSRVFNPPNASISCQTTLNYVQRSKSRVFSFPSTPISSKNRSNRRNRRRPRLVEARGLSFGDDVVASLATPQAPFSDDVGDGSLVETRCPGLTEMRRPSPDDDVRGGLIETRCQSGDVVNAGLVETRRSSTSDVGSPGLTKTHRLSPDDDVRAGLIETRNQSGDVVNAGLVETRCPSPSDVGGPGLTKTRRPYSDDDVRAGMIENRRQSGDVVNAGLVEQRGGKMVAELVGVFNELTERMGTTALSSFSTQLLFRSLTLSIPLLRRMPPGPDGRPPLSRALAIACTLADLQMDAEVISAGIMRVILEARALSLREVQTQFGIGISHLLHESLRMRKSRSKVETLDDESAASLRKFCLSYYDIRAVVLELVVKHDRMRHLGYLSKYHQQRISLEVMKIYSPLAHTIGATALSLELEDLSFQHLFPHSYHSVDQWLKLHPVGRSSINIYKDLLLRNLRGDQELAGLVDEITVKGRRKSRFSTMKKLLKDGRGPEDVNDVLGLRVILSPKHGGDALEMSKLVCYRAHEIVRSLWREIASRTKDYIARPKSNGYRSLHLTVDISDSDDDDGRILPMEVQIRTKEMDLLATGGSASHSLYKGGLTDPSEAKRLKAIMMAAAELAALRLRDPEDSKEKSGIDGVKKDRIFHLLDTNGDGRISLEELTEVMKDLGATGEDAVELMQVLDSNSDGSLSSDEFDSFQKQVNNLRTLEDEDDHFKAVLSKKLSTEDNTGLIKVYHKQLGDTLSLS